MAKVTHHRLSAYPLLLLLWYPNATVQVLGREEVGGRRRPPPFRFFLFSEA